MEFFYFILTDIVLLLIIITHVETQAKTLCNLSMTFIAQLLHTTH